MRLRRWFGFVAVLGLVAATTQIVQAQQDYAGSGDADVSLTTMDTATINATVVGVTTTVGIGLGSAAVSVSKRRTHVKNSQPRRASNSLSTTLRNRPTQKEPHDASRIRSLGRSIPSGPDARWPHRLQFHNSPTARSKRTAHRAVPTFLGGP